MALIESPLNELTYQVNGLAFKTHNELKAGHRERIYQWRLADLLIDAGLHVDLEQRVEVYIDDTRVGYMFLDLWVEHTLVVECKAFSHLITNDEIQQTIAYMTATASPMGLIYNFGRSGKLDMQRVLPPQRVADWHKYIYRSIWVPEGHSLPPVETVNPSAIRFSVVTPTHINVAVPASPIRLSVSPQASAENQPSAPIRLSASSSVENQPSAYAASGVNIDAGNRAVELMRDAVKSTYGPEVLAGIGAFGGLFDASALKSIRDPVLVASTDGVGTKVKLAAQAANALQDTGRYESIGHDIVNHCINDILVQGARPLFFLDYIASSRIDPDMIAAVVSGISAACREAGCALLGGETAEMPGVYQPAEFDVAGTIVGIVERSAILPRTDQLCAGDVLIGLRSSGPHTNGYSLIRKVFDGVPLDTVFPELGVSLADALLASHRSYLPLLQSATPALHQTQRGASVSNQQSKIKALAHVTGGGFLENIPRVLPDHLAAQINLGSWPVPPLFDLIQHRGHIAPEEMYRVFNMGLGMIAMVAPENVHDVQTSIPEETFIIGRLIEGSQRVILA